jgi:citrate synthase
MALLSNEDAVGAAASLINAGMRVPGWGNSFIKDGPDSGWAEVDRVLLEHYLETHAKIVGVTEFLHARRKKIFPNPSIYTAATALILGLPPVLAPYLFIAGRLNAWTDLIGRNIA